jgi:hypothetical protein
MGILCPMGKFRYRDHLSIFSTGNVIEGVQNGGVVFLIDERRRDKKS